MSSSPPPSVMMTRSSAPQPAPPLNRESASHHSSRGAGSPPSARHTNFKVLPSVSGPTVPDTSPKAGESRYTLRGGTERERKWVVVKNAFLTPGGNRRTLHEGTGEVRCVVITVKDWRRTFSTILKNWRELYEHVRTENFPWPLPRWCVRWIRSWYLRDDPHKTWSALRQ